MKMIPVPQSGDAVRLREGVLSYLTILLDDPPIYSIEDDNWQITLADGESWIFQWNSSLMQWELIDED